MKRLTKPAAEILREEIEAGNVAYTLEAHLMLYGSCRTFQPKPAVKPTRARPGTKEKVEVMRMRVALGQSLNHPKDNLTPLEPSNRIPQYVPGLQEIDLGKVAWE